MYTEGEIRDMLSVMIDTREICGSHEGEDYTIALMSIEDEGIMCWQSDVGDYLVPFTEFKGCASQDCIEEMIWRAFIRELGTHDRGSGGELMVCPRCAYKWITRIADPKKCPNCQFRLLPHSRAQEDK